MYICIRIYVHIHTHTHAGVIQGSEIRGPFHGPLITASDSFFCEGVLGYYGVLEAGCEDMEEVMGEGYEGVILEL